LVSDLLLNVPLGVLTALLVWHSMARLPRHQRTHKLDLIGATLMIAASGRLPARAHVGRHARAMGLADHPWSHRISMLLTLVFAWVAHQVAEPFLPLHVLANPVMRQGTIATSCALSVMTGFHDLHAALLSAGAPLTPTQAGAALIPIIVFTTPGSMLSGRAMMYLTHYKISPYNRHEPGHASGAALTWWPAMPLGWRSCDQHDRAWCRHGVPIATVSIQNAVDRHDVGTATGTMNFFRALGAHSPLRSWGRSCSPALASRPSAAALLSRLRP